MIRGHVFVVNKETLPIHLQYRFVGVSSGDKDKNISLLADALRVKKDDFIFFYIEGNNTSKGRFFGIYRATDDKVYHVTGQNAQAPNLPKKLIYRKRIIPYRVYQKGVLEWVALDKFPTSVKDLLWTLIYRKMKGKRGNTMLFPWETERLISLIRDVNGGRYLPGQNFTFDVNQYEIRATSQSRTHNIGVLVQLTLNDARGSEKSFQAYILQNLSIKNNTFYPNIFGRNIVWIGNEVFAGCGMQKIDLLIIEELDQGEYMYRIIELKHPKTRASITGSINSAPSQLEYYINWAREDLGGHIIGSRKFNIKPILLSFTRQFGSVSSSVISKINLLNRIADTPEIWEMDYNGYVNRVL